MESVRGHAFNSPSICIGKNNGIAHNTGHCRRHDGYESEHAIDAADDSAYEEERGHASPWQSKSDAWYAETRELESRVELNRRARLPTERGARARG